MPRQFPEDYPAVLTVEDVADLLRTTPGAIQQRLTRGTYQGPQPFQRRPSLWLKTSWVNWFKKQIAA
jgi:hypothetical protein